MLAGLVGLLRLLGLLCGLAPLLARCDGVQALLQPLAPLQRLSAGRGEALAGLSSAAAVASGFSSGEA